MIMALEVQQSSCFSTGLIRCSWWITLKIIRRITPTGTKATNGLFSDEYWQYACTELETIEGVEAWGVVDNEYDTNVII